MNALLLAGGYGKRLRPITDSVPKCLVKINGKPLLEHWLELLNHEAIKKIIINTHYLSEMVTEFIQKSKYKKKIILAYEEKLLGTGGTILRNKEYFKDDLFFVAHADNFCKFSITDLLKYQKKNIKKKCDITMLTFKCSNPSNCGIIKHNDFILSEYVEKPISSDNNIANAAIYLFNKNVITYLENLKIYKPDISKHVIPYFIGRTLIYNKLISNIDIGTKKNFNYVNKYEIF